MTRQRKLAWAVVVAGMLLTLWSIWYAITRGSCAWYGYQTERDTRYAAFVGCLVKTERGWTPRHELRTEQ